MLILQGDVHMKWIHSLKTHVHSHCKTEPTFYLEAKHFALTKLSKVIVVMVLIHWVAAPTFSLGYRAAAKISWEF